MYRKCHVHANIYTSECQENLTKLLKSILFQSSNFAMKRAFSLFAAISLLAQATPVAHAASFIDTDGTRYETSFTALKDQGVIRGYSDGRAYPNLPLQRVEALKVISELTEDRSARAAAYRDHMPPMPLFYDTDQTAWYAPYIEVAFEDGLVTGYDDGSFRPAQYLRVEEAITLLMRAYGEKGAMDTAELSPDIDNQAGQWFTPFINVAISKNLIMADSKLRLGSAITRGQFVDMAYRIQFVTQNNLVAYQGAEPPVVAPVQARPVQPQPVQPQVAPVQAGNNYPSTGITVSDGAVEPAPLPVSDGVVQTDGVIEQTTVAVAPIIDHPYASEKYFAISMPSLGITDLTISRPSNPATQDGILEPLDLGVGHLFALPGGGGKIMIYGHSSGYPWDVSEYSKIFRRVNELEQGDRIYVTYAGNLYVYEVTHEQTIQAKDTGPFQDNGNGEELILYTCWPPDSVSQRYLVHAVPVETIAAR